MPPPALKRQPLTGASNASCDTDPALRSGCFVGALVKIGRADHGEHIKAADSTFVSEPLGQTLPIAMQLHVIIFWAEQQRLEPGLSEQRSRSECDTTDSFTMMPVDVSVSQVYCYRPGL